MNDNYTFLIKKRDDYLTLSFQQYLNKYYAGSEHLGAWKKLQGGLVTMEGILNGYVSSSNAYFNRPIEDVKEFYKNLKIADKFDEDLMLFFTMLMSAGFFDYYRIDFDDWVSMKNYRNPGSDKDKYLDDYTILEALSFTNGQNWIKSKIASLEFWRILGGH